ncbi:MAG: putative sulfate exporter family transporter, partial [Rhodothermales bacterium]|nr:putative sulfate exporter family transporter [Rhodothermales bacterium]
MGLLGMNPDAKRLSKWTGQTLRASIVLLGFGVPLAEVLHQGAHGLGVTVVTIAITLLVGLALGRWLGVADDASMLVTGGTAICGGSAIAAIAPAIEARSEATGVALAVVFVLNGLALFVFPPLGHAFGMTPTQFGAWAALAIHDTSSVVGAAAAFSPESVPTATVLKLTRALWIVPVVLALVAVRRRRNAEAGASVTWQKAVPPFIGLFVMASAVRALVPQGERVYDVLAFAGRRGLVVALLLVGYGLTRQTLRAVGVRPLVQGVLLWLVATLVALAVVRGGMF